MTVFTAAGRRGKTPGRLHTPASPTPGLPIKGSWFAARPETRVSGFPVLRKGPSDAGPTLAAMTLGIVVFGAAFLVGLGLGTYTRRPLSTAFLVLGSFSALLVLSATGEVLGAAAVLTIVLLLGLVAETMRETVGLLVGRW
jgi:hypothetical protein